MLRRYIGVFALLLGSVALLAQVEKIRLEDLSESERKSIEAIALYPPDVRLAVLELASHPAVMIKIKRIQEQSRANFQEVMEAYPREQQELIWDLTRFEGLLEEITLSDHSRKALEDIVKGYPGEVVDIVFALSEEDFVLIEEVIRIQLDAEAEAMQVVESETPDILSAYRLLLDNPEVLEIMGDELELAILVGNLYEMDREWVIRKADSLNLALAAQNSRALEDWKASIENDPEAREELLASLDEYEEDYPFDDVYYDAGEETYLDDEKVVNRISVYYLYHYPFWFGYPYWYEYPRWRPYPVWYDWGFYPVIRSRRIIIFSLPRYHTVWWYLNKPRHHYRYTHLSSKIIEHRNTHREHGGTITSAVNRWQTQNRDVISDDLLSARDLSNNLKLYGQMEENRLKYNARNPSREMTAVEYTRKYERKYEPIKPKTTTQRRIEPSETVREQIIRDLRKVPARTRAPVKNTIERKEKIQKIDRAKEFHRSKTTKKVATQKSVTKKAPQRTSPRKKTVEPVKKQSTKRKTS